MIDVLGLMQNKVYKDGGIGPTEYDCFGFAVEVYRQFGIALPLDYSVPSDKYERDAIIRTEMAGSRYREILTPEVPSLVAFIIRPPFVTHVGVVIGACEFIHMVENAGVCVNKLSHPLWKKRIAGMYRYTGDPT